MLANFRRKRSRQSELRADSTLRRRPSKPTLEVLEDRSLLNAGVLDPTFGNGGTVTTAFPTTGTLEDQLGQAVVVQPDGKIVAAGSVVTTTSDSIGVARYNPSGSLDTTFGNAGLATVKLESSDVGGTIVSAMVLESDGGILVVGAFGLVRFTANGVLDTTFGTNGIASVSSLPLSFPGLAVQPDGKILVSTTNDFGANLERFNANGTPDPTFGNGGTINVSAAVVRLALEPDGKILLAGNDLVRLNPDGSKDVTFGTQGEIALPSGATSLTLQNGGRILVGTAVDTVNSMTVDFTLERFEVNGSIDPTFGTKGSVTTVLNAAGTLPTSLLVQSDGKIVAFGGSVIHFPFNDAGQFEVVRYNPNGTLDDTFGSGGVTVLPAGRAGAATLQANGQIVAVGSPNGSMSFLVARYTADPSISDPDQRYLTQVHLDLLQRPPDPGGVAGWSAAMQAGMTRTQVIVAIEGSTEYHTLEIEHLYGLLLNRAADAAGLAAWLSFLGQGHTGFDLEAQILGSNEYFAGRGGNSNTTFLQTLYDDVLQRPIDSSGAQFFGQQLAHGTPRTAVAAAVLASSESDMDEVSALYVQLLRRNPDAGGLAAFAGALQQGAPLEAVYAMIAGSDEYIARLFS